jgi:hypothetical protein
MDGEIDDMDGGGAYVKAPGVPADESVTSCPLKETSTGTATDTSDVKNMTSSGTAGAAHSSKEDETTVATDEAEPKWHRAVALETRAKL